MFIFIEKQKCSNTLYQKASSVEGGRIDGPRQGGEGKRLTVTKQNKKPHSPSFFDHKHGMFGFIYNQTLYKDYIIFIFSFIIYYIICIYIYYINLI